MLWKEITGEVINFLEIVRWPILAAIGVWVFRTQVSQVMQSLATRRTRVTIGGFSIDLSEMQTLADQFTPQLMRLYEVANLSPQAARRGEDVSQEEVNEVPPAVEELEEEVEEEGEEEQTPTQA